MTFGERLREYRQTEGLSQEQLAESLNVSRQAITKWENDKGLPDIDNLIAISKMMKVTLDELINGGTENGKKHSGKDRGIQPDCLHPVIISRFQTSISSFSSRRDKSIFDFRRNTLKQNPQMITGSWDNITWSAAAHTMNRSIPAPDISQKP